MTNTAVDSPSREMDAYIEAVQLGDENRFYAQSKRAAYYKQPGARTSAEQELAKAYVDDLCGRS